MLVDECLSADCTNDAHPVLQRLLVDGVVVLLQRRLTAEVLAAAAKGTSAKKISNSQYRKSSIYVTTKFTLHMSLKTTYILKL